MKIISLLCLLTALSGVILLGGTFLGDLFPSLFLSPMFSFPEVHEGIFPGIVANAHGFLGIFITCYFFFAFLRQPSWLSGFYALSGIFLILSGWHFYDSWLDPLKELAPFLFHSRELLFAFHLSLGVTLLVAFFPLPSAFSFSTALGAGILFLLFGLIPFPHGVPLSYKLSSSETEKYNGVLPPALRDWGCRTCHRFFYEKDREPPLHSLHANISCVACHRGSGGTLFPSVAHGDSHWAIREPLLKGAWIQSTCSACHASFPKGAKLLEQGERLWEEGGCAACHLDPEERLGPFLRRVVRAVKMSPLSKEGEKLIIERGYPELAAFLAEAIVDPSSHLPHSLTPLAMPASMPVFAYSPQELTAITIKVLSLREWGYPVHLRASDLRKTFSGGAAVFRDYEKGCIACHRFQGEGGDLGPPLDPWIGRDPAELARILTDPNRPPLPGYPPVMPRDYKIRLSSEELHNLVQYLTRGQESP